MMCNNPVETGIALTSKHKIKLGHQISDIEICMNPVKW